MDYTQVKLQRGDQTQTGWIPRKFATQGRALRLKQAGQWEEGWIVMEVWQTVDEEHLPDSHSDIKAHRKATGDTR